MKTIYLDSYIINNIPNDKYDYCIGIYMYLIYYDFEYHYICRKIKDYIEDYKDVYQY